MALHGARVKRYPFSRYCWYWNTQSVLAAYTCRPSALYRPYTEECCWPGLAGTDEIAPLPSFITTEAGHLFKESAAAGGLNLARLTNRRLRLGDSPGSPGAFKGRRIVRNRQGDCIGASPRLPLAETTGRALTSHGCHIPHLRLETTQITTASYP